MPETRVAVLAAFLPNAHPDDLLPHDVGKLDLTAEEIAELLPDGSRTVLGLRDGGWSLTHAGIETGGLEDDSGSQLRDIYLTFRKAFSPADPRIVIADALSCGATPNWGVPGVSWDDYRDDAEEDSEENARRDLTGARTTPSG